MGRITAMMSRRRRNRQTKLLHDSLVSCSSQLFSVLIYFTVLLKENRTFEPTSGCYWLTAVLEGRRKYFCELYLHARQSHMPQGCVFVIVPRVVVICSLTIEPKITSWSPNRLLDEIKRLESNLGLILLKICLLYRCRYTDIYTHTDVSIRGLYHRVRSLSAFIHFLPQSVCRQTKTTLELQTLAPAC